MRQSARIETLKSAAAVLGLLLTVASSTGFVAAADAPPPAERRDQERVQSSAERITPRARVTPMSDRCETIYVNCMLSDRQPRGSSCWCVTPFGPSYGRVR